VSKDTNNKSSEEIFAEPIPHIEKLTTGINRIASGDSSVNSYAMRNSIINAKKKAAICQKNGNSLPPSAVAMQAQGQRMLASLTVQRSAAASPKPRGKNLYKKGYTVTGTSFTALETEAALDIDHSAKLGRNIGVANPNMVRPSETDAHHIVAREDYRAELSRIYIFTVGIGVNDADNGGIMPRFKMTFIPSLSLIHI
jgi:hypothetical protein